MNTVAAPIVERSVSLELPAARPRERILIIDDEEHIRSTLGEFISQNGYAVETAGDGARGIELLARGSYDLVLCDLRMPGVDGTAVLEEASATQPATPVIVMTGHATIESAIHALRSGAYDYLRKPFALSEIERTIENCFERKRLEERNVELTRTNARLREIERIKDDLLSTVSHEFRTPLAAITGFLTMMDMQGVGNLRPDQTQAIEAIRANVGRLDTMIGNLLTLTESHDGGYHAVLEEVSVAAFLDEYLRSWRENRRGDFSVEIDEAAASATVKLDRARFPLVLSNLLDNAFKFTRGPGPGKVLFRVRRAENRIRFEVHDDGVGIAPTLGDRLFERFTQGDMSSTREYSGVGLGLAVVREVVRAHSGTVSVEPPELGGASLRVTLPAAGFPHNGPTP
jgi:signal transduction histidine kinase